MLKIAAIFLLLTAALNGCGRGESAPAQPALDEESGSANQLTPRESTQSPAIDEPTDNAGIHQLYALADSRQGLSRLQPALVSGDVAMRRASTLAIARLRDPGAFSDLRRALRDPDPETRRHASLGIGALEDSSGPGGERALLAALAAEMDRETRVRILLDLGRVGSPLAGPALREALAQDDERLRAAACRALGEFGLQGTPVEDTLVGRVAAKVPDDPSEGVRLACAYALTRLPLPDFGPALARATANELERAANDEGAEVRVMAVRALGRLPGVGADLLLAKTVDPDWRVAVQAFRGLAARVSAGAAHERQYAAGLERRVQRILRPDMPIQGPELHVLLTALDSASGFASRSAVFEVAEAALSTLERTPPGLPLSRDRGLAHCAAAKLVDLGRGWPARLASCGMEQVASWERDVLMAEVLGAGQGADPQRAAFLTRLYRRGDPRVRVAVLAATESVLDPVAERIVFDALSDGGAAVQTAACDGVVKLAPRWRPSAPPPVASVRDPGAPLPVDPVRSTPAEAIRGLRVAYRSLTATDELEGLQSWISAVEAIGDRGFADELAGLAIHSNVAVRERAKAALRALGLPETDVLPAAIANPISPDSLSLRDISAVVRTSRGEVQVTLFGRQAPSTVSRFMRLARSGFYDGLSFHRVVPAFVVQGGDPTGTGYGGPGWSQRCEDNGMEYERGTLGMALAGRDTGGSQFFITHGSQPHLEGRYTAFGRVVSGMEIVDALQVGDEIQGIDLPNDPG